MAFVDFLIYSSIAGPFAAAVYALKQKYEDPSRLYSFLAYSTCCFLSYLATVRLIPVIKEYNLKADLFGMDLNKKGTKLGEKKVPESLGVVPATIFLVFNLIGILYSKYYENNMVFEHTAGILSISFVVFLGFSDDVLDLPWRYKLILPTIASLPILVAYPGVTTVVVPIPLRFIFGGIFDLGFLYYVYMGMLAVFCTNSINIYAGINGLEVGQSIVIGCAILLHNAIEIYINLDRHANHFFSILIILPFIFTSLGLFKFNKYPSQVFVGDTFCYWAGMTFAVAGILGHFSKTVLLFFIPQIINFLYSLPQLFKIIPCPRHRLPKFNSQTELMEPIKTNLTLINLFLWIKGPTSEKRICDHLLVLQVVCCGFGFLIRYGFGHFFF